MPGPVKGIKTPYKRMRATAKRITSSAIKERVRDAINEPHIDLSIPISRVYGGNDPPEQMWDDIRSYRDFIDDGLSNNQSGLLLSSVETCTTLLSFEQKIESWYKSRGWTVIPG
jgi:hypothetical protein